MASPKHNMLREIFEQPEAVQQTAEAASADVAGLTTRELEVLRLIGRGSSNAEIARGLVIGEGTVKTHINHILTKLGLRDRATLIVFAFDHGLVQPRA